MKRICSLVLVGLMSLSLAMPVFAGTPSLDDVVAGQSVTETTNSSDETEKSSSAKKSNNENTDSLVNVLRDSTDLSHVTGETAEFARTANSIGSKIFQYLSVLVSVGVLVMVGVDMVFITLPFTRKYLANGYMGNPGGVDPNQNPGLAGGGMQGGMPGMGGMGMGGGYGSRMGGMGMGGGYGSRMGGMGMGNPMAGRGGMMGEQAAMQNQPALGRVQWVSNAALNAIASESASNQIALIGYIKSMAVTIVLASVILVLASTGVLGALGAAIGSKISGFLQSFISSLL